MQIGTKKCLGALAVTAGALIASSAHAQFYLGGGVGRGHVSLPGVTEQEAGVTVTGSAGRTSDTTYKLYGGYQLTSNWGVELGYNDLGNKYSVNVGVIAGTAAFNATANGKVSNWYVAGTGTLPLGNGFSLLGKLGLVRNHSAADDVCISGFCTSPPSSDRTQRLLGVGVAYALNDRLALRFEYEDFGKVSKEDFWETGGSGAIEANAWNLSLKYAF